MSNRDFTSFGFKMRFGWISYIAPGITYWYNYRSVKWLDTNCSYVIYTLMGFASDKDIQVFISSIKNWIICNSLWCYNAVYCVFISTHGGQLVLMKFVGTLSSTKLALSAVKPCDLGIMPSWSQRKVLLTSKSTSTLWYNRRFKILQCIRKV